jgi:hypothetical protein
MDNVYELFELSDGRKGVIVNWENPLLADEVASEIRGEEPDIDLLVLRYRRLKPSQLDKLFTGHAQIFIKRFRSLEIFILYSKNYNLELKRLNQKTKKFSKEESLLMIEELRNLELLNLLQKRKALFPETPPGTFIKSPSGAIVNTFIRTGNVQVSIDTLDSFFFWMLPWLKQADSLILDTWTIGSIALNASRRLPEYAKELGVDKRPMYVDVLSKYYGNDPSSREELKKISTGLRANGLSRPLFIFSACATGASLEKLISDVSELTTIKSAQFVALYSFTPPKIDKLRSLCVVDKLVNLQYRDDVDDEPANVFVIDGDTYMPNVLDDANEERSLKITRSLVKSSSDFFSRYVGLGAFSVHKSVEAVQGRHHAFYVDFPKVLEHPDFNKKLFEGVKRLIDLGRLPKIILAPDTAGSDKLAERIKDHISSLGHCPPQLFKVNRIFKNSVLTSVLRSSQESDNVLVAEDVCVTGSTLAGFQGQLRDIGYKGNVDIMIGLMRTESEKEVDDIKRFRTWDNAQGKSDPSRLHFVEQIYMPNWGESDCPWCQEKRGILRWLTNPTPQKNVKKVNKLLRNRLVILEQRSGLQKDCFISRVSATDGSLWIRGGENASQGDIVNAVASGLQNFRVTGISGVRLGGPYPKRVILSDLDLFADNWQNTVLQASIWRVAKSQELQSVNHEAQASRIEKLNTYLNKLESGPVGSKGAIKAKIYETALNILNDKIPHPVNRIVIPASAKTYTVSLFLKKVIDSYRRG